MEYNEVLVDQVTNFLRTWRHKDKNPTMYGYLVFVAFIKRTVVLKVIYLAHYLAKKWVKL